MARDDPTGAVYSGGPLFFGAFGCLLGGYLTDRYIRRTGDRRWGRRWFGMTGHALCGGCYLFALTAPTALQFALAISLASFCNDLAMGSAWACTQDIGRRHAAIVAGCMNTVGNLGGAAANFFTGLLLERSQSTWESGHGAVSALPEELKNAALREALAPGYVWNFWVYAIFYFVASALWLTIDATRPVLEEDKLDGRTGSADLQ